MFDSAAVVGDAEVELRRDASFGALAAVRGASRASRGDPGRVWPPRDARDVRGSQGVEEGRHEVGLP
jgi:hypothetical protein